MSVNGLVVMTPTSIASTGTGNSSSIGANGKVTFSSCATLGLNGVFTSSYDNYMVVIRGTANAAVNCYFRLRASGVDNSTANSYVRQYLDANGTTLTAARLSAQFGDLGVFNATQRVGITAYFFDPCLTQPTAIRALCARDFSSAGVIDHAVTHNQSVSYDGFTLDFGVQNSTGEITVYGFNQ